MVKVVGNLISTFCRNYDKWDRNLPLLTLAYRSSVHEVTGYTPNFVMMGREVSLPLDVMLGSLQDGRRQGVPEYVQNLQLRMETCFAEVRDHLKEFGERQRRYYDLSAHGQPFKPGTPVYLREKTRKVGVSPKLAPKWLGPYLVRQQFGTIYEVLTSPRVSKLYHFDLLKECRSTDLPAWLKRAKNQVIDRNDNVKTRQV